MAGRLPVGLVGRARVEVRRLTAAVESGGRRAVEGDGGRGHAEKEVAA